MINTIFCKICNTKFEKKRKSQIYCSIKCSERRRNKILKIVKCKQCNKKFKQNYPTRFFCSHNCKSKAYYYRNPKEIAKKNYDRRIKRMEKDPEYKEKILKEFKIGSKKYEKSEKGIARRNKFNKTERGKEIRSKAYKKWANTDKGRAVVRKHLLKWAHSPKGREGLLKYRLSKKGLETRNKYRKYWNSLPKNKIVMSQRTRIAKFLKQKNVKKNSSTYKLLGCSPRFLKKYLEGKFKDGMNWDNYGPKGWHVDHIKPISKFKIENIEEKYKAFHYSNLQPMWAMDNLKKSNKY